MIPKHYDLYPEPLEVIQNWGLPFALGNVIKYIARAGKKSSNSTMDDLIKAADYLVRYMAFESDIDEKPFCIEFYPEPTIGVLDDWPESENAFYPISGANTEHEYREEIRKFIEHEKADWAEDGVEDFDFNGTPVASAYRAYRDWALKSELAPLPQRTFIEFMRDEENLGLVFTAHKRKEPSKDGCY